ncbi:hypothetical protein NQD34_013394, partial [Periophthalmus magnuspinnatus]
LQLMASNNSTISDASKVDLMLDLSYAASYVAVMLPISLIVLFLGFERCKQQATNPCITITNADFFTLNLAAMEVIGVVGYTTALVSISCNFDHRVGFIIGEFPWTGQMVFPIFACIEHYIAVVHPMTYLNLKHGHGLWIRHVSNASLWILAIIGLKTYFHCREFLLVGISNAIVFLIISVFCCLSVLHVLSHSKPGERIRSRIEQSRRHAIQRIVVIMAVLFWKFMWSLI